MSKRLRVRELSSAEADVIESLAVLAAELRLDRDTVRAWLKRFNALGLAGLEDAARSGRPRTYTVGEVGEVVAAALTNPKGLGLPFASWTLDRLEAYLNEAKGVAIKRSRIDEILLAEGMRRRKQETWMRWGRKRPKAIPVRRWFVKQMVGGRLSEPDRRPTTGGVAKATCLEPSNLPAVQR